MKKKLRVESRIEPQDEGWSVRVIGSVDTRIVVDRLIPRVFANKYEAYSAAKESCESARDFIYEELNRKHTSSLN